MPVFERSGDDLGLCRARRLEAWLHWNDARAEAAAQSWERAAAHARTAGDRHEYDEILTWIASSLWFGPVPAEDGIRRCEAMRAEVQESPEAEAAILRHLAGLHAMVGRFPLARQLLATSNAPAPSWASRSTRRPPRTRPCRAARRRPGCGRGEPARRAIARSRRWVSARSARPPPRCSAQAILEQGRDAEAEEFAALSAPIAAGRSARNEARHRAVAAW